MRQRLGPAEVAIEKVGGVGGGVRVLIIAGVGPRAGCEVAARSARRRRGPPQDLSRSCWWRPELRGPRHGREGAREEWHWPLESSRRRRRRDGGTRVAGALSRPHRCRARRRRSRRRRRAGGRLRRRGTCRLRGPKPRGLGGRKRRSRRRWRGARRRRRTPRRHCRCQRGRPRAHSARGRGGRRCRRRLESRPCHGLRVRTRQDLSLISRRGRARTPRTCWRLHEFAEDSWCTPEGCETG